MIFFPRVNKNNITFFQFKFFIFDKNFPCAAYNIINFLTNFVEGSSRIRKSPVYLG